MATLQVKGIDEDLYRALGTRAKLDNRSISQQVVKLIRDSLARSSGSAEDATRAFLALCGSWKDDRSAREIAASIRKSRRSGRRFKGGGDVSADTDTIIYAIKGEPQVTRRLEETAGQPKAVSVITYGELFFGAMKSVAPQANLAKVRRVGELFPVIESVASGHETFGSLKARATEASGEAVDDFDLVITSTASSPVIHLSPTTRGIWNIPGLRLENWIVQHDEADTGAGFREAARHFVSRLFDIMRRTGRPSARERAARFAGPSWALAASVPSVGAYELLDEAG